MRTPRFLAPVRTRRKIDARSTWAYKDRPHPARTFIDSIGFGRFHLGDVGAATCAASSPHRPAAGLWLVQENWAHKPAVERLGALLGSHCIGRVLVRALCCVQQP